MSTLNDSLIEIFEGLKLSETTPKRKGINIGLSLAQVAARQHNAGHVARYTDGTSSREYDEQPAVGQPVETSHFSNCSVYDESGTEIPNAQCDCGGAVEDKTGTPIYHEELLSLCQDLAMAVNEGHPYLGRMAVLLRGHVSPPERESGDLTAEDKIELATAMASASLHSGGRYSVLDMRHALDAILMRFDIRRRP